MPFSIGVNNLGIVECPCCREMLWHCKKCWEKYHGGSDYIPPKYFGEKMISDKILKRLNFEARCTILVDKHRPYKEGEYH